MKKKRVGLGNLLCVSSTERDLFRPAAGCMLLVLSLGGIFTLFPGYIALALIVGALNDLCGWKLMGVTSASGPKPGTPQGNFMVVMTLVFSALPGLFAVVMGSGVITTLRFWLQPAIFDHERGVFRRGAREICRLDQIRAIQLRRITDPNYPDKAQVGMAVVLEDGAIHPLEWRFSFQRYFGKQAADPHTDLGMLYSHPRQEAIRRAVDEFAKRIGVPVQQFEERGNFTAHKGM